jgi:hypothetical protein
MEKDGWQIRPTGSSSRRVFVKGSRLVSIHYHPHKAYGPDMLKDLLRDIGWTEKDLGRLKLIIPRLPSFIRILFFPNCPLLGYHAYNNDKQP